MNDYVFVLPDGTKVKELPIQAPYEDREADPVSASDCYSVSPASVRTAGWRNLGQPGEKEKLSFWDIGNLLQSAGSFLRDRLNLEVAESARYSRDEAQSFLDSAIEIIAEIRKIADQVETEGEAAYEAYGEVYSRLYKRRREFVQQIGDLPSVQIPYNLKELIGLAERCDNMPDSAWKKVIELAAALRQEGGTHAGNN